MDTPHLSLSRLQRWRPWQVGLVGSAVVGLPLLVAAVVLYGRHYHPVLDLAMTEFRVRDVGSMHTPLIGLPGRIGKFPEQGSHPGPLSFYLIAPVYRLFGASAWAMLVGAIAVNIAALGTSLGLAFRRGGWWLTGAVAVWLLVSMRGYGVVVLTQPWNPYLPLLAWTVVVLAAWMVLEGDHFMLVPLVAAGSLCAQTHVPYLLLCVGLFAVCACVTLVRWRRGDRTVRRSLAWSVGLGTLLWLPPLVDQAVHTPGNIRMLQQHFMNPSETPIGVRAGLSVLLRHLDVTHHKSMRFAASTQSVGTTSVASHVFVKQLYIALRLLLQLTRLIDCWARETLPSGELITKGTYDALQIKYSLEMGNLRRN